MGGGPAPVPCRDVSEDSNPVQSTTEVARSVRPSSKYSVEPCACADVKALRASLDAWRHLHAVAATDTESYVVPDAVDDVRAPRRRVAPDLGLYPSYSNRVGPSP